VAGILKSISNVSMVRFVEVSEGEPPEKSLRAVIFDPRPCHLDTQSASQLFGGPPLKKFRVLSLHIFMRRT
jgi:hypothetical protein